MPYLCPVILYDCAGVCGAEMLTTIHSWLSGCLTGWQACLSSQLYNFMSRRRHWKADDEDELHDVSCWGILTRRLPPGATTQIISTSTAMYLAGFTVEKGRTPVTWFQFSAFMTAINLVLVFLYLRCESDGNTMKSIVKNLRTSRARFQILVFPYQFLSMYLLDRCHLWRNFLRRISEHLLLWKFPLPSWSWRNIFRVVRGSCQQGIHLVCQSTISRHDAESMGSQRLFLLIATLERVRKRGTRHVRMSYLY